MSHSFMAKSLVNLLHLVVVLALLIISQKSHFTSSNPTGFSLKLIPRDSPESPLYPGNLTQSQKLERLVMFSKARAQYLEHKISSSLNPNLHNNANTSTPSGTNDGAIAVPQDALMTLIRNNFYYLVQMVLGTPPTLVYIVMDTGGGLVWTQCMPCVKCYKQTSIVYDSRTSSSYWKLPCSHFLCNGPRAPYQCVNNQCVYSVTYGGGTGPTKGVASVETIRFVRSSGDVQAIDGIVFGCSNENLNFGPFENTPISGIMGLSWAPDSLVTQLADFVTRRFSYCLVPFDEDHGPTILSFGDAIPTPRGIVLTTKFVLPSGENPNPNYYFYLNLLDISVGWEKLGFPPGTFELKQDGTGGLIIDSGAPSSLLVDRDLPGGRNPYKEVIGAFQRKYDSMKLKRRDNVPGADLCYELIGDFKDFVTMTYHLEGADYIVDGIFTSYFNRQEGYFCVALLGGSTFSVLGAFHQQNTRIIYDGNILAMQFVSEVCI